MPENKIKKSKLLVIGIFLFIFSYFSSFTNNMAKSMNNGIPKALLFLFADALRACFFIGIVCIIIGVIKNRKLGMRNPSSKTKEHLK